MAKKKTFELRFFVMYIWLLNTEKCNLAISSFQCED